GASDILGSTANFARAKLSANAVYSPTTTIRFVLRSQLGAIMTGSHDFRTIPPSQRFYAGGSQSVRGYGYEKLSPTNPYGEHVGGRYLATASFETDWFFYGNFGIAAFFDAGDVENKISNFDFKKGAGLGFRWGSPVGMVRLDVAYPFDDPDTNFRIDFS